jgi:hypothetical protein
MGEAARYPSGANIKRIVKAVREAGVKVGSVKIGPDGSILTLPADTSQSTLSPYDTWKAQQVN